MMISTCLRDALYIYDDEDHATMLMAKRQWQRRSPQVQTKRNSRAFNTKAPQSHRSRM